MDTIPDIIEASGGAAALADRTGLTREAVNKWRRKGIPDWHWDAVMEMSGATLDGLYQANRLVRPTREDAA